jgi:hypothetical protein
MTLRDDLSERILALPSVESKPSRFGGSGDGFFVGRREFAHFHPGNELDLRLTKSVVRELRELLDASPRISWRKTSDWVEVRFSRRTHLDEVMELVERAVAANS